MNTRWRIQATVPHSEVTHFNPRGMIDSDQQTATFFLRDESGGVREVKKTLAIQENKLTSEGVQNFSLEAAPLRER